jgi:hypothetical protein
MSEFYRHLAIPMESFNKQEIMDLLIDREGTNTFHKVRMWKWWGYRDPILTAKFHNWLDSVGCNVFHAELFHIPPNGVLPWHVDQNPGHNVAKINFVWGADEHEIQWGKQINSDALLTSVMTPMNTKYVSYEDDEIEIIEKTKVRLDMPMLADVGQPHRVLNYSTTSRWCFSVVIHKNKYRILFKDAVEIFSEYVVD